MRCVGEAPVPEVQHIDIGHGIADIEKSLERRRCRVRNTSLGAVKRPPIRLPVMEVERSVILTLDLVNVTV
jgi:hypothetical protein